MTGSSILYLYPYLIPQFSLLYILVHRRGELLFPLLAYFVIASRLDIAKNIGGGQNFERLIFRNFKIANIKITKNDLFDSFIIKFIFSLLEIKNIDFSNG